MDKQQEKQRHGQHEVELPPSQPREEKSIDRTGTVTERREQPRPANTPETGPGGE